MTESVTDTQSGGVVPAQSPAEVEASVRQAPSGYSPVASTSEAILDAALSMALEVGFRKTTISEVARRAGVSRMTAYRYFTDNQTLINALQTREFGAMLDNVRAVTDAHVGISNGERAAILLAETVRQISVHPIMKMTREVDPTYLFQYLVERYGSTQRLGLYAIEQLLQRGIDDGSLVIADVHTTATMLLMAVQSIIVSYEVLQTEGMADKTIAEFDRMVRALLGLPPVSA